MEKYNHTVDVTWKYLPDTDSYFDVPPAKRPAVDALFQEELARLVPQATQTQLLGINVPNSDYDDIIAHMNPLLVDLLDPPPNYSIVFGDQSAVWWDPTPTGHRIKFDINLVPAGGGTVASWTLTAYAPDGRKCAASLRAIYECVRVP